MTAPPATRRRLPNRRASELFDIEANGARFTVGFSGDLGSIAEIFISAVKVGSSIAAQANDLAIVASLALQHGVPLDVIRHALGRNGDGTAATVLGAALDLVAEMGRNR